jgi:hypothetical protein
MTFYTRFGETKSTICQNGHIQMCPFLPIPLHFQIASAASDYVYIVHILIKRVRTLSLRRIAKGTVYGECTAIMPRSPNKLRDTITDSQIDAILTSSVISTSDRGHLR